MERLSKASPTVQLTDDQKRLIAELENEFKARVADRELSLQDQIRRAMEQGEAETQAQLERQLVIDRRKLSEELEAGKERIRQGKS